MKYFKRIVLLACLFIIQSNMVSAQDLLSLLDSTAAPSQENVLGTFKSVRLINGYTSEIAGNKELLFSISHRFNPVNSGIYEFFGLDQSTIRFGFEYGLYDRISLGIGRSNFEKLYDGFIKIKIAKQSRGNQSFPFTITLLEGLAVQTVKWPENDVEYPNTARMYYVHELFIARKFNDKFSAQLTPVVIHRNMVKTNDEYNTVPAIGIGGRYRITNRFTFVGEYYYVIREFASKGTQNSLALGVEIETGGHVFQIHLSNSYGMTEKAFIPETTGKWVDGDIQLGFNIIRLFSLDRANKRK